MRTRLAALRRSIVHTRSDLTSMMGVVFGKINSEMPEHAVVYKGDGFEVWKYPSSVAAVVDEASINPNGTLSENECINQSFRTLARYIGVFSDGENQSRRNTSQPEKIAMTAPVVMTAAATGGGRTSEKIAMTAPVVMSAASPEESGHGKKMAFLLPKKFATIEDAPEPTNPAVKLELVPERYEAVMGFSGFFPYETAARDEKAGQLREAMAKEGIEPTGTYSMCGYNPPFTLPFCRRNEVHYPVGENEKFDKV